MAGQQPEQGPGVRAEVECLRSRMRGGQSESRGGWGLTEALPPRANVPGD